MLAPRLNKQHQVVEHESERVHLQGGDVSFAGKRGYEPSLVKAMIRVFAPYFVVGIFFKLINDVLLFIQPYLLGYVDCNEFVHLV